MNGMKQCLMAVAMILLVFLVGCTECRLPATGAAKPWTARPFKNDPRNFQFAIVSDKTGSHRPGVFQKAVWQINLLQPEFVICVGDLIEGYSEDGDVLGKQYDEFDAIVGNLEMRFFRVAGNHDISNDVMAGIYRERYAFPYYHFVYKDVLFLVVCTEDPPSTSISDAQVEYMAKALQENKGARWTFVFMHQPLFVEHGGGLHPGWGKIEKMLEGRPHTVFTGHLHSYAKHSKHGQSYIHLATTGGGSDLSGVGVGIFDHIVWVTMTDKGPVIANLAMDGIYDEDVVTAEFREKLLTMAAALGVQPVVISEDTVEKIPASFELENVLDDRPLTVIVSWHIAGGTDWTVSDRKLSTTIAPGGRGRLDFVLSCKGERTRPAPTYTLQFAVGDCGAVSMKRGTVPLIESVKLAKVPAAVAIDGNLDEWQAAKATTIAEAHKVAAGGDAWKGPKDCSAQFRLAKDAEAVYLAVEVTDDAVFPTQNLVHLWDGDAVEVFFDCRAPDKRGAGRYGPGVLHLCYAPGKADGDVILWAQAKAIEGFVGKSKRTADGYTMELKFPVEGLKKAGIEPGETFNFDIAIDDADAAPVKRKCQLFWSSLGDAFQNASAFGRVRPAE